MRIRLERHLLLLVLCVVAWPLAAPAHSAVEKAGRGLAAMTTPFLEIPGNIVATTEIHGPLAGWTRGLAMGVGMTVMRPLVGVYEFLTAPLATPKNFEPILEPEYPWSYFGTGHNTRPSVAAGRARKR